MADLAVGEPPEPGLAECSRLKSSCHCCRLLAWTQPLPVSGILSNSISGLPTASLASGRDSGPSTDKPGVAWLSLLSAGMNCVSVTVIRCVSGLCSTNAVSLLVFMGVSACSYTAGSLG